MSTSIDKWRSIGVPSKKRGSHRYNAGGTRRTVTEAVQEVRAKNPAAGVQEMQQAAYKEAMGAPSWQKCADLVQAGAEEIGRQHEPPPHTWTDSAKPGEGKE